MGSVLRVPSLGFYRGTSEQGRIASTSPTICTKRKDSHNNASKENQFWKLIITPRDLFRLYTIFSPFNMRNTYIVWEHHMVVLLANHASILYIGLCVSGGSHTQYIYMINPRA